MAGFFISLLLIISFPQGLFSFFKDDIDSINLVGTYEVTGENGLNNYKGIAYITRYGDNYRIQWEIKNQVFYGFGIRDQDVLAVSYISENNNRLAVIAFRITPDGHLCGKWAYDGEKSTRKEYLQKIYPSFQWH